jgi:hypothetical protein
MGEYFDFTSSPSYFSDYPKLRRYIKEQQDLINFLKEILISTGYLMTYGRNGKYHLRQIAWYFAVEPSELNSVDLDINNEIDIKTTIGRRSWKLDRVVVNYDESAKEGDLLKSIICGDESNTIAEEMTIDAPYIHDDATAYQLAANHYYFRAETPITIEIEMPFEAFGSKYIITNYIKFREELITSGRLLYPLQLLEFPFQLLQYERNYNDGKSRLICANITRFMCFATWRADDDPHWEDATEAQRIRFGFWTEETGDCDPTGGNQEEYDSNWQ